MKTIGRIIGVAGLVFWVHLLHAQIAPFGISNNDLGPIQSVPPDPSDSIVQLTADEQGLQVLSPDQIPVYGTFWTIVPGAATVAMPFPCPPPGVNLPTYAISQGIYLVDDSATTNPVTQADLESQATTVLNLIGQVQTLAANQQAAMGTRAMADGAPAPGSGTAGDAGGSGSLETNPPPINYGTNLWIAQENIAAGYLSGIASNTVAEIEYEIQSWTDLTQSTNWVSQGFIVGSEATNWTPLNPLAFCLTNNFFIGLRSWASSDGSGLPDWWELEYFNHLGIDPNALDSAGDGYTIYQKFILGVAPGVWHTPPAPKGVTVSFNYSNDVATVSWSPSPGPVTNYTVMVSSAGKVTTNTSTYIVSAASNSVDAYFVDPYNDVFWEGPTMDGTVQIQADYAGGNSALSSPVLLQVSTLINLVAGPNGSAYLTVSGVPQNTKAVEITLIDTLAILIDDDYSFDTNFNIPITAFTNGFYLLPNSVTLLPVDAYGYDAYYWYAEIVDNANNTRKPIQLPAVSYTEQENQYGIVPPYFDARSQLKQNLIFQLRAATTTGPFQFTEQYGPNWYSLSEITYPSNYLYSGFYQRDDVTLATYSPESAGNQLDPFWPINNNLRLENFSFNLADINTDTGQETTGVDFNSGNPNFNYGLSLDYGPSYQLTSLPGLGTTVPALLGTNQSRWLDTYTAYYYDADLTPLGIYTDSEGRLSLSAAARNYWGLPFLSAELTYNNGTLTTNTLYSGEVFTPPAGVFVYAFAEAAQPKFQTVEYDFWLGYPFPGDPGFSITNTSPLIVTPVGTTIQVSGYAKLAVANAYYGVYAYLAQYFTNAYQIDTNGITTTNMSGVLSPYGSFFATQPGPVALVTMPDIDTGVQGTGVVHCISLVLDKNHDGTMDGSFSGPDMTSQASPMVWWINDDYDYSGASWNYGNDVQASWYYNDGYQQKIDSQRDLEDYARLWICGMPALTNGNYQVTLSWANVSSGNPTINLFDTVETNGGIGYLTNLDTATAEAYNYGIWGENRRAIAQISPGQPFTFPASYFTNAGDKHFLFDGAITNGAGELMLTIADGNGNTIAQNGAWLDLHHIDDFFEQAVITNNMSGAKSNWTSTVEIVQPAVASALGDDQDLIVLIHGINVKPWDCVNDAETVCKRLYWAGYHGKFAEVEWPCNLLTPIPSPLSPAVFNDSELQGYKASQALTTYLTQLRARFPGYRLHLLVHSQGNAMVSEAIRSGVTFDTYILTQGALPASAYDVDAPVDNDIASYEGSRPTPEWQPMGYRGIYTNFTGRIVNFYNSQDGVLNYWVTDQKLLKPSVYFDTSYYFYNGTNSYFDSPFSANYLVTDPEESRADVSRSRTLPIGQSGPASGHGVIQSAVDLNANFGFNSDISEHSAQWTRPIQTSRPYFQQVLRSCQIIPAP